MITRIQPAVGLTKLIPSIVPTLSPIFQPTQSAFAQLGKDFSTYRSPLLHDSAAKESTRKFVTIKETESDDQTKKASLSKFHRLLEKFYQTKEGGHLKLLEKIEALLKSRVDVRVNDKTGFPPIVSALANKEYRLAELLLEYGADPDACSSSGLPLIFGIVGRADLSGVSLLLKFNVNKNWIDKEGQTPLENAKQSLAHLELIYEKINKKREYLQSQESSKRTDTEDFEITQLAIVKAEMGLKIQTRNPNATFCQVIEDTRKIIDLLK